MTAISDSITIDADPGERSQALVDMLQQIAHDYAPAALASSLSIEDMVVTDAILRHDIPLEIFTLDTGRMHQDTLDLIDTIERHYGTRIRVYLPDPKAVMRYVAQHGRDAFYESVELRRQCCAIRKTEPLKRALAGKRAWITGLRRSQSVTRAALPLQEYDTTHGLEKFNPLAEWSEQEVWAYLYANDVPYNRLYEQGYRSIGCAPCTRPTVTGEDVRAGRWWWEQPETKECGLHVGPDGRLVRSKGKAS
ncbi:MAG TPA: phosphoadenylyl-sulfate reductase [Burkholderiales bacterium]|nr:phosphoadenylyl-sulfate reductase [Burkholderiales bacterium]